MVEVGGKRASEWSTTKIRTGTLLIDLAPRRLLVSLLRLVSKELSVQKPDCSKLMEQEVQ